MKYLNILIIFFFSSFCFCQNNAYEAGEWLKFRIHYGLITAGQATLEVKSELLNDQEVFHIIGFGETTGMTSWFFKVEDHYQSYVLKDKDLPVRFVRNINEVGYKK